MGRSIWQRSHGVNFSLVYRAYSVIVRSLELSVIFLLYPRQLARARFVRQRVTTQGTVGATNFTGPPHS